MASFLKMLFSFLTPETGKELQAIDPPSKLDHLAPSTSEPKRSLYHCESFYIEPEYLCLPPLINTVPDISSTDNLASDEENELSDDENSEMESGFSFVSSNRRFSVSRPEGNPLERRTHSDFHAHITDTSDQIASQIHLGDHFTHRHPVAIESPYCSPHSHQDFAEGECHSECLCSHGSDDDLSDNSTSPHMSPPRSDKLSSLKSRGRNMDDPDRHALIQEIMQLRPVTRRQYWSPGNMSHANTHKFLAFLKRHKKLQCLMEIHERTRLSINTIRKWHSKLQQDEGWSPLLVRRIPRRQAMDDVLEDSIMNYIVENFLKKGLQFNDKMCRFIALRFWEQHKDVHGKTKKFNASYSWIRRFKERYKMVNRRAHYKRRPHKSIAYLAECRRFISEMHEIYQKHEAHGTLHLLVNIDETSWKTYQHGHLTWASKGAETVQFSSIYNDKECITAVAAITAEEKRGKLPLCLIRKGKTNQSTEIFTNIASFFQIQISEEGWSTEKCFAEYLLWLRKELDLRYQEIDGYSKTTEIDLVLDIYPTHRTDPIKRLAQSLHFKLHFVPAGATDLLQPLDRYVFGALKCMGRAMYYEEYIRNPTKKKTYLDSALMLVKCWAKINSDTISKAWHLYKEPTEDEFDFLVRLDLFDDEYKGDLLTISDEELVTGDEEGQSARLDADDDGYTEDSDDDIESTDDSNSGDMSDLDLETTIDRNQFPIPVINRMREIEKHESQRGADGKPCFKRIANKARTCYFNTTLQLLSTIPFIRDAIAKHKKKLSDDQADNATIIGECLRQYDAVDDYLPGFPQEVTNCFQIDVAENIIAILPRLKRYGIQIDDQTAPILQFGPEGEDMRIPNLIEIVHDFIAGKEFEIHNTVFFQKHGDIPYDFPQFFVYQKYYFLLKSLVVNITGAHYYLYVRKGFSRDFFKINDAQKIKYVDWPEIYSDTIFLAMYIVIHDDSDELLEIREQTKRSMNEEGIVSVHKEELFKPDEELIPLLCEIFGKEYHGCPTRPQRKTKRTARLLPDYVISQLNADETVSEVTPLVRYQF